MPMTDAVITDAEDDVWLENEWTNYRGKLVDLTRRNRLLHFGHGGRSPPLRIVNAGPDKVLVALLNGRKLHFKPLPDPNGNLPDEQTQQFVATLAAARLTDTDYQQELDAITPGASDTANREATAERALADRVRAQLGMPQRPGRRPVDLANWAKAQGIEPSLEPDPAAGDTPPVLQTLLLPQSLNAKISRLAHQVAAIEAETGVSTLHFAFGFLEWHESNHAEAVCVSPLLLLPVAFSPVTVGGLRSFALVAQDTEAKENIALRLRLKQDFNIELPSLPEDGASLEAYVAAVRSATATRIGWRVRRWMTLAPFSFARIAMYEDLDPARWPQPPTGVPLVREVLYGRAESGSTPTEFAENHDVDDPQVADAAPKLVTDADSSQHSALIDVARGRNLVIEGPPGTGKSQTIVNIIANALHGGKTVLFVAEKMAALDVVKARLDEAGLGELCLLLHAAGSRPASVIEALRQRQALRRPAQSIGIHPADRARQSADRLYAHRQVLATRIGPQSRPVYDVIGILCEIERRSPHFPALLRREVAAVRGNIDGTTYGSAEARLRTLEDASRRKDLPGWNPLVSPWNALTRSDLRSDEQRELLAALDDLTETAYALTDPENGGTICLRELRATLARIDDLASPNTDLPAALLNAMAVPEVARDLQRDAEMAARRQEAECALAAAGIKAPERFESSFVHDLLVLHRKLKVTRLAAGEVAGHAENVADCLDRMEAAQPTVRTISELFRIGPNPTLGELLASCEAAAFAARAEDSWLPFRQPDRTGQRNELEALRRRLRANREVLVGMPVEATNLTPQEGRRLGEALRRKGLLASLHRDVRQARAELRRRWRGGRPPGRKKAAEAIDAAVEALDQIAAVTASPLLGDRADDPERILGDLLAVSHWQHDVETTVPSLLAHLIYMVPDDMRALGRLAASARDLKELLEQSGLAVNRRWQNAIAELQAKANGLREMARAVGVLGLRSDLHLDELSAVAAARLTLAQTDHLAEAPTALIISDHGSKKVYCAATFALGVHSRLPRCGARLLADWTTEERRLRDWAAEARKRVLRMDEAIASLRTLGLADIAAAAENVDATTVATQSRGLRVAGDEIGAWLAFATERDVCRADHLARLVFDAFARGNQFLNGLDDALDWLVASAALRAVDAQELGATRAALDRHRDDFQSADRDRLRRDRKDVVTAALGRSVPHGNGNGPRKSWTDGALVQHQMSLQQRHVPVRNLLRRARGAITAMAPCLMMSPLTVAQFLDPRGPKFDLLVMDEASQIRPESALGALLRCKQAVVVGDSNQLPPTSFFDRAVADGDDDENGDGQPEESILEKAKPRWRPARSLIWHYRSRHESLIRFSNRSFYQDRLVLFPSPRPQGPHLGVELVPLDGIWQDRRNVVEAATIARSAQRWMRERPDLSLGLVAMNGPQRDQIQAEFDRLTADDDHMRDYIDIWRDRHEPFFVKNLENVQGDERDAIFVSLGWGRDQQGSIYQRFHPLGREDGWRRLNVLFTRAKHKLIVFASLRPEDIHVDTTTTSRGVRVLRQYLEYLRDGRLDVGRADEAPPDSPFEESVAAALREAGHIVAPQVGVQGYRIDIGVLHPDGSGRFILGIECDGATYHRSASARDRDRLRQDVLERLGWRITRVWSTEWFRDWNGELRRLQAEIAQAVAEMGQSWHGGTWYEAVQMGTLPLLPLFTEAAGTAQLRPTPAAPTLERPADLAERLRQFRERVIMADLPGSESERSILREEMITSIMHHRLDDPEDFHCKIPEQLRVRTDGRQTRYLERICEIVAEG